MLWSGNYHCGETTDVCSRLMGRRDLILSFFFFPLHLLGREILKGWKTTTGVVYPKDSHSDLYGLIKALGEPSTASYSTRGGGGPIIVCVSRDTRGVLGLGTTAAQSFENSMLS